jgi:hypothetical protein
MWGPAVAGGPALAAASKTAAFPPMPALLLVAALGAAAECLATPS